MCYVEIFMDILNFVRSIGDWKKYMQDKETVAFLKHHIRYQSSDTL